MLEEPWICEIFDLLLFDTVSFVGVIVSMNLLTDLLFLQFFRYALNVQIYIKMHRSDFAEKQLRVMQQNDEDHTLTQLASAWLNLAVV